MALAGLRAFWKPSLVSLVLSMLASCGGGGGGSSAPAQVEPAMPTPAYSGLTTAAAAGTANANAYATDFHDGTGVIKFIGTTLPQFAGLTSIVSSQGTATIVASGKDAAGNSWGDVKFYGYLAGETTSTWTGEWIYQEPASGTSIVMGFKHFAISLGGVTVTLDGTLSLSQMPLNWPINYASNLSIAFSDRQVLYSNYVIAETQPNPIYDPEIIAVSFSGVIADSNAGAASLSMSAPWTTNYSTGITAPFAGAYLTFAGASGTSFQIVPYNFTYAGILIGPPNASQFEAERIEWGNLSSAPPTLTPAVPVADTGPTWVINPGDRMQLNALASGPSYVFQTFHWSVEFSPPGSQSAAPEAANPLATFKPDTQGQYLLGLDVTNSSGTGHSDLLIGATPTTGDTPYAFDSGTSGTASVGSTVGINGNGAPDIIDVSPLPGSQWCFLPPPGSHAVLSGVDTLTPTFVPDISGRYELTASNGGSCGVSQAGSHSDIDVGPGPVLAPRVDIVLTQYLGQGFGNGVAMGDFNNDGKLDLVFVGSTTLNTGTGYTPTEMVIENLGGGAFKAPQSLYAGGGTIPFAAGDISLDGLSDLAVGYNVGFANATYHSGFDLAVQQAGGGGLGTFTHYAGSTCPVGSVVIGGPVYIGGTAADPLLLDEHCGSATSAVPIFDVYAGAVGGVLGAPQQLSLPKTYLFPLVLSDLNGDGLTDIVTVGATTPSELDIVYGQAGGGFSPLTPMTLPENISGIAAADLNGDGRIDLVVALQDKFAVFLQKTDGTLASPVYYALPGNGSVSTLAIGDMNHDGVPDIIFALHDPYNTNIHYLAIYSGTGSGQFGGPYAVPLEADINAGSQTTQLLVGDILGNGHNALMLFDLNSDVIHVWETR